MSDTTEQTTDLGKTEKAVATLPNQPQEPEPVIQPTMPEDYFEVRVTVTIAIPYRGEYPGCRDATERVMLALSQTSKDVLPQGTHYHGSIDTRVRTAKEIAADNRRAAKRAKERGYV